MNPSNSSKIFNAFSPFEDLPVVFEINFPGTDAHIAALRWLNGVVHLLGRHGRIERSGYGGEGIGRNDVPCRPLDILQMKSGRTYINVMRPSISETYPDMIKADYIAGLHALSL